MFTTLPHRVVARDWFARTCIASNGASGPPLGTRYSGSGRRRAVSPRYYAMIERAGCRRGVNRADCGRGPGMLSAARFVLVPVCRIVRRIITVIIIIRLLPSPRPSAPIVPLSCYSALRIHVRVCCFRSSVFDVGLDVFICAFVISCLFVHTSRRLRLREVTVAIATATVTMFVRPFAYIWFGKF